MSEFSSISAQACGKWCAMFGHLRCDDEKMQRRVIYWLSFWATLVLAILPARAIDDRDGVGGVVDDEERPVRRRCDVVRLDPDGHRGDDPRIGE